MQWGQVQDAIAQAYTQVVESLKWYYSHTLLELPDETQVPEYTYDMDPTQTPQIFANGGLAAAVQLQPFDLGTYGALAASAINALWASDKVFVIKISDSAYGKGKGGACKAFDPSFNVCINGVAHIVVRWQLYSDTDIAQGTVTSLYIDKLNWFVRGITTAGGSGNQDFLSLYKLKLPDIVASILKTFAANGFPFTNQNGATINQLKAHPLDTKQADLMFFSLPVCDIDGVLGPGKHLVPPNDASGDDPIVRWGACTCAMQKNWPSGNSIYANPASGISPAECKNQGWANN